MEQSAELVRLEEFVDKLLNKYNQLKAECRSLQETLRQRDAECADLKNTVFNLSAERTEVSNKVSGLLVMAPRNHCLVMTPGINPSEPLIVRTHAGAPGSIYPVWTGIYFLHGCSGRGG
jgi:hypothetical protein